MDSKFIPFKNVQLGLKELGNNAPLMKDNLEARISDESIFGTYLDSRTIQFYGGVNEDNRPRFKIDHDFDLSFIANANIDSDGSVRLDSDKYSTSQGTEFIIISRSDIKSLQEDYAIRADKYTAIRDDKLNNGKLTAAQLKKAGGFKINSTLTTAEAKTSDGWLELMVGKNKATAEEYAHAKRLLVKYVNNAEKNNCFKGGNGMGFYVETDSDDYKAQAWFVIDSDAGSNAGGGDFLNGNGCFLRVRDVVSAEGGDAQKKDPAAQLYTPRGIMNYLKKNPVGDNGFAAALLNAANAFYQGQIKAK